MKRIMKVFAITFVCLSLCGCSYFKSKMNDIKGSLIGNGYTIDTYDNYGNKVFETNGQKIKITGNKVKESSYNSDGSVKETYSLSSVITITIDGNEIESCGDTCIFEQKGLDAEVDFTKKHINSRADGITANTAIANYLNKYKNLFGNLSSSNFNKMVHLYELNVLPKDYKYNINASISREEMILMLNKMYPKVKKFSKFTVNTIKSTSKSVSGYGEKGATIKVYVNGKKIGKTVTASSKNGYYKITIPRQKKGKKVTIKMSKPSFATKEKSVIVKN